MNPSDQVRHLLKKAFTDPYPANFIVLVVWEDPIAKNHISHRSAAFEKQNDADLWAKQMIYEYSSKNMKYSVYLNGEYIGS